MSYKLIYSQTASKFLLKLELKHAERIIKKLDEVVKNPNHFFTQLDGREELKLRVGDYRLLARISHLHKKILIQDIGHRKYIYKKK